MQHGPYKHPETDKAYNTYTEKSTPKKNKKNTYKVTENYKYHIQRMQKHLNCLRIKIVFWKYRTIRIYFILVNYPIRVYLSNLFYAGTCTAGWQ